MTLPRFVIKNMLRNKRRSLLTGISLAFSFLLLIFMVTIWRTFFVENWTAQGALRLICRHRASFLLSLPSYYEEKIRRLPGVVNVTAANVFDGVYKTGRGQDEFGQFGAEAETFPEVYPDFALSADQAAAWKRDPSGAIASAELARSRGWQIGDRIMLEGVRYPINLELTLRGIYHSPMPNGPLFFNWDCVERSLHSGQHQVLVILADSPKNVGAIAAAVDNMFRDSPAPTRTEAEKLFNIHIIEGLGNVKLFILSICFAVLFATVLTSASAIAMSIRERTREVAVLRSLGFAPVTLLCLLLGESVGLCVAAWFVGSVAAVALVYALVASAGGEGFQVLLKLRWPTFLMCFLVAVMVGCLSAIFPARRISHKAIVEGLRYIG